MRWLLAGLTGTADVLLFLWVCGAAMLLKLVRCIRVERMPLCRRALMGVGVFPILRHYYEPQFDHRTLRRALSEERRLPGIEWNEAGQLEVLASFRFAAELDGLAQDRRPPPEFHLNNGSFESGDAESLYQVIRLRRPRRIMEIGGGHSTLMAARAVRRNELDDADYRCRHVCIDPWGPPWLAKSGAEVIRRPVEELGTVFFDALDSGDLLFIDSTHMIRPQGDVLFEILELLPSVRRGVLVHIHDIFSPRDYIREFLINQVRFWNEQYLLEALLAENPRWRVFAAINFLKHRHYDALKLRCPYLAPDREPGSFYLERV